MTQRQHQRAVPAHRMAEDADPAWVDRQVRHHQLVQLEHIAVHLVVRVPRRLGGVDIKARRQADIPAGRLAVDGGAARTGVERYQHHSEFGRHALGPALEHEGFLATGQAGQVKQRRPLAGLRLRRHEHRETHRQADGARRVRIEALHAAEAGVLADQFERFHGVSRGRRCGSTRRFSSDRILR